jgi:hypothetical protein
MKAIYDVDYFIKKFEAIKKLGLTCLENGCALSACGVKDYHHLTKESKALIKLFVESFPKMRLISDDFSIVWLVNDGLSCSPFQQPTAKERILAALYDIKKMATTRNKRAHSLRDSR